MKNKNKNIREKNILHSYPIIKKSIEINMKTKYWKHSSFSWAKIFNKRTY